MAAMASSAKLFPAILLLLLIASDGAFAGGVGRSVPGQVQHVSRALFRRF
ncbi:hypothetical protein ACP4OV_006764 [Aristida adscensionis]